MIKWENCPFFHEITQIVFAPFVSLSLLNDLLFFILYLRIITFVPLIIVFSNYLVDFNIFHFQSLPLQYILSWKRKTKFNLKQLNNAIILLLVSFFQVILHVIFLLCQYLHFQFP